MAKAPKSFASVARGYANLWKKAELVKRKDALAIADRIIKVLPRYTPATKVTGVPEWAIGILHYRESNLDFGTYLGNGQTLGRKTTIVPKGRGPFRGEGAFERGAIDALELQKFDQIKNWTAARFLYESERFNGFGYYMKGINSPYVWGGTTLQQRGKYVKDGVFDPNVMDTQLGSAAILKALCERSPAIDDQVNPKAAPAELKTSKDVHDAIQGGKPAAQIVEEREMANEVPTTATADVVPFYQKKAFWAMVLGTMIVPLVNQVTKGAFEISPWMQDWIATAIVGVLGGGGVAAIITSNRITPTGAARSDG